MTTTQNPNLVGSHQPEGQEIHIPTEGAELKAYLSRPAGVATAPGVVVIHENKGLVRYLRDVADGLASAGYIAAAPDLLSREGGTDSFRDPETEIPAKLMAIPQGRLIRDTHAVVDWLKSQPGVSQLGITGFCWGGGIVWRMATLRPDLKAAVPFYGNNPPLDQVPNIKAAVLAIYGEYDERINGGLPNLIDALKKANVNYQIKAYPEAGHAFHNHTNPPGRYKPEAARQAWSDALAWLDRHLKM